MEVEEEYEHETIQPRLNSENEVVVVRSPDSRTGGSGLNKTYKFERVSKDVLVLREAYNGSTAGEPLNETPAINDGMVVMYLLSQMSCEKVKDGRGNTVGEIDISI